jgi:hypothetical protein
MMRFTLGTPDRGVERRTFPLLFHCLSFVDGLGLLLSRRAIRSLFHLWAYVSPMESIVSRNKEQKSFCDGENPHLSDSYGCRNARALYAQQPRCDPFCVLSVFSLEAPNFYFVRENRLL